MRTLSTAAAVQGWPYWSLLAVFGCWKLLLGLVAFVTPSPAYDTSTTIALLQPQHHGKPPTVGIRFLEIICNSLTRWDAIYFAKIAERGYRNEQEWAFGWGYTRAIAAVRIVLFSVIPVSDQLGHPYPEIISAVLLSNACHLASAIVLYKLTLLRGNSSQRSSGLAWLAAVLHILSPAGLFLSAPYSESLFSFLAFSGTYLYALSLNAVGSGNYLLANAVTLCSAIVFSAASTVRSNGLLNGILFLFDFVPALCSLGRTWTLSGLIRVIVLGVGGLLVGVGLALPQYIAWGEYCASSTPRPWCAKLVPSIYTWVQDFYWDVGLFRYWTPSNLPLFLLAAPTLFVLFRSGLWGAQKAQWDTDIMPRLAIAQLLLAGMAIVSYHVQIITRLSSGCAVWYWWVAATIVDENASNAPREHRKDRGVWIVRWMVMYGLIQGVLFAGFLPPA